MDDANVPVRRQGLSTALESEAHETVVVAHVVALSGLPEQDGSSVCDDEAGAHGQGEPLLCPGQELQWYRVSSPGFILVRC